MPGINASALLLSQGWAGPGHALGPSQPYRQHGTRGLAYDPSSVTRTTSSGLLKPLLVSKKDGNKGLGRKAHEPARGNEWWLKGFESALSSVGQSREGSASGTSTPTGKDGMNGKLHGQEELQRKVNLQMGRFGGLYSYFLPGGSVGGTLGEGETQSDSSEPSTKISEWGRKKRKSDVLDDDDVDKSMQKDSSARDLVTKKSKKNKSTTTAQTQFTEIATFLSARDVEHERKRQRKEEKRKAKAMRESQAFGAVGEFIVARDSPVDGTKTEGRDERRNAKEERRHRKEEKRKRRSDVEEWASPARSENDPEVESTRETSSKHRKRKSPRLVTTSSGDERPETREERKARRALRKAEKARDR
jgi:nucleolar protein TMA23